MQFGLQFETHDEAASAAVSEGAPAADEPPVLPELAAKPKPKPKAAAAPVAEKPESQPEGEKVVSLDAFRKK